MLIAHFKKENKPFINHLISQRNLALDCTFTFTPLMNMATLIYDIGGKQISYTFKVFLL